MARYDPAGDLAPRDVVATAIVREQMRTGRAVYLSLAHLDADARARPVSDHRAGVCGRGARSRDGSAAGQPGGALHVRRRRHGPRRPHVDPGAVRGRRGRLHGRARREPPGEQLAARGARLRRTRRRRRCSTPRRRAAAAPRRSRRRASPPAEAARRRRRLPSRVDVPAWSCGKARGSCATPTGSAAPWPCVGAASRRLEPALAAASPRAAVGTRVDCARRRGSSRARRSAARRAAAGTGVRTFPRATIYTGRFTSPTGVPLKDIDEQEA